ncbi:MAG TPA: serpin family protein [Blastocatellia bacterium]|nr:serpin family protein [Blastocatellia bacterium]
MLQVAQSALCARVLSAGLMLLLLIGCSAVSQSSNLSGNNLTANHNGAAMEETQNRPADVKVDSRLVSANTGFGFRLYAEVLKEGGGKNIFLSPSSVGLALAMAYNGAEGETKRAMAEALGLQGLSLEEVNRAYEQLRLLLENPDPKVRLEIANSLWGRKGVEFIADFIARNQKFYGAEVNELNFDDPGAPATINSWVSNKTGGKIDKIVDNISPDTILFLINAIYFKGMWTRQFDKAKTKEDAFYLAGGSEKRVPMMAQSGKYRYFENDSFQAVSLPYGDKRVSMYVFLPQKNSGLDEFHKQLSAANWDAWMSQFRETKGDIVLPRFKMEYGIELNDALKALGMAAAFDPERANFSGMARTDANAFISKVKHKTFVDVNEEGTEAAAVTSVEVQITSMQIEPKPFRMVVNRPFFCAIRDNQTGTILFMGSIREP